MARKRAHGEIRQSQIITTFGPGAMVDLPRHSVLIGGLEFWSNGGEVIQEPRLTRKLAAILNVPSVLLKTPPPDSDDPNAPKTGIGVFQFPQWFITQDIEVRTDRSVRTRLLVHRRSLTQGFYLDQDKKKRRVVPIRFVRACRAGHIADIDWNEFVHKGKSDCLQQGRQLYVDETGTSGDLSETVIRCECKFSRQLIEATSVGEFPLGSCDGQRPWLGPYAGETCGEPSRLLVRSASNAYFAQVMSVISLPERDEQLEDALNAAWEYFELVENIEDLRRERKRAKVKTALEGFSDEDVFAAIQGRRSGDSLPDKPVKIAELETLMTAKEEFGGDRPNGIFYARTLLKSEWDRPWLRGIERVVLIHRLREVVAQLGFTRFEPVAADIQGELDAQVKRASIAREISWLPAFENRGEGIFLQFSTKAIEAWLAQPRVKARAETLLQAFKAWSMEHSNANLIFPGVPYYMLHSFAHLLITAVSLRCGYPASALRERVYAKDDVGFGVLIYTGATDAEGTLGGLVEVGRRIHDSIKEALQWGRLCSNDPVCAQHDPKSTHEHRYLHGASCHGCLLIAEPSCERHNDLLDRSLVVQTVANAGAEFFPEVESVVSKPAAAQR